MEEKNIFNLMQIVFIAIFIEAVVIGCVYFDLN